MPQYNPRNVTDHGFVLHIMIIWSKAMKHKDYIITDLDKKFLGVNGTSLCLLTTI